MHAKWSFVATEIDQVSLDHARQIVCDPRNNAVIAKDTGSLKHQNKELALKERITLVNRTSEQPLLLDEDELASEACEAIPTPTGQPVLYHASMCNPPFYSSADEMRQSYEAKSQPPNAVCHGADVEMICPGGEVDFVRRMIEQSFALRKGVIWFTSMVGKLSSVQPLLDVLQERKLDNVVVTELVQGLTKRWAIAWSHLDFRLAPPLSPLPAALKAMQPPPGRHVIPFVGEAGTEGHADEHLARLRSMLVQRGFVVRLPKHRPDLDCTLLVFAFEDTWSRKARRKAQRAQLERKEDDTSQAEIDKGRREVGLGVRISILTEEKQDSAQVTWIYGKERQLFDSFTMSVLSPWIKGGQGAATV